MHRTTATTLPPTTVAGVDESADEQGRVTWPLGSNSALTHLLGQRARCHSRAQLPHVPRHCFFLLPRRAAQDPGQRAEQHAIALCSRFSLRYFGGLPPRAVRSARTLNAGPCGARRLLLPKVCSPRPRRRPPACVVGSCLRTSILRWVWAVRGWWCHGCVVCGCAVCVTRVLSNW
jgi:hypothetical protein